MTDSSSVMGVSFQDLTDYRQALDLFQGNYQLEVSNCTISQALQIVGMPHLASIDVTDTAADVLSQVSQLKSLSVPYTLSIADSAANISENIDALAALNLGSVPVTMSVTDGGFPTLAVTATQFEQDWGGLYDLKGSFDLTIDASTEANINIVALYSHATTVSFPDMAVDYSIAPTADGGHLIVTDTETGRASSDQLTSVTALTFKDGTYFVVAPPSSNGVTTGNIAELYAAVLARVPDAAGLNYYQEAWSGASAGSLITVAQDFLQSSEYVNNAAHDYAQSAAGDAQFITDTYENLLHRAPEAGAVAFYQNTVAQFTDGVTPGTIFYSVAQREGHAQVLVYFAASQEFLNDVQITAQHPADAQHWLFVL